MNGENSRSIGRRFGISGTAVCRILEGSGIPRRSQSDAKRRLPLDQNAFDIWTPQACYWAGFLFADGFLCIRAAKSAPELALMLAEKDRAHVELFRSFLKSGHALTPVAQRKAQGGKIYHAVRLSVRSCRLVSTLKSAGMDTARVPIDSLAQSRDFWRGTVDGDGCLGIYGRDERLELLGTEGFLHRFIDFLRSNGINPLAAINFSKGIHRVIIHNGLARRAIALLYRDGDLGLARKKIAAARILAGVSAIKLRHDARAFEQSPAP